MTRRRQDALIVLLAITQALAAAVGAAAVAGEPVDTGNPILFVTQVPVPADFATIGSTFANHNARPSVAARGGDLWIRYPDGALRNLTTEAGYGQDGFQGAGAIAVRQPCVHWDGTKAVFSMVVGAPTTQYQVGTYRWQLYEVTGLEAGMTAVITKVPNQPETYNNVSPIYASDGRIIFTSDRPHNGAVHLYPQRDEYESTPVVSGIWNLDPSTGDLDLLVHAPSGAFWPSIDTAGRVIFTKWDHLQRDQQADAAYLGGNDYGTFNWSGEAMSSVPTASDEEFFPEPRDSWITFINDTPGYQGPLRGWAPNLVGHRIERFQPWQINQDGTEEETLNHVGRHELAGYFNHSFNDDPSLVEFIASVQGVPRPIQNMFQLREDPLAAGAFYGIDAPTFGTHACGQLVRLDGLTSLNADDMAVAYVTHPDTATAANNPSPDHSGLYRNPLALHDGTLVASHTPETRADANDGSTAFPQTRYDLRLKIVDPSGAYAISGAPLTAGIVESITYWNPDVLVTYDGPLWELDPVEVVARPAPVPATPPLPAPEQQAITDAGVTAEAVRVFLEQNDLALVVSRDVTTRDDHDRQQPFNLRVPGTSTETLGDAGPVYDVSLLQFFQGDLLRGMTGQAGRRVLAVPMHDVDPALQPAEGAPGAVRLGEDGSMAALVPARRAMSWQLTDDAGQGVVRERYWLTFQPGEIRTCTSCHGVNHFDQAGAAAPTNTPLALTELLVRLRDDGFIEPETLLGDVDGDGQVGFNDLTLVLGAWGTDDAAADLDGDGMVGFADLVLVLGAWTT